MLTKRQIKWLGRIIALDHSTYAHDVCNEDMRSLLEALTQGAIAADEFSDADIKAVEVEANRQYWRLVEFLRLGNCLREFDGKWC